MKAYQDMFVQLPPELLRNANQMIDSLPKAETVNWKVTNVGNNNANT
jgi:hypothetical protein